MEQLWPPKLKNVAPKSIITLEPYPYPYPYP